MPSNLKRKAKRLFVHGMFLFQLGQPLVPCAAAVIMPLPPTAIDRLSPFEQDRILENKNSYPQIASIVESKTDKMVLTDQQIEDFNLICYKLQNGSITLDKAIVFKTYLYHIKIPLVGGVVNMILEMLEIHNVCLIHHLDLNVKHFIQ